MNLYNIPKHTNCPRDVHAVVEITKGTSAKYEYDPILELFRLDRCLNSAMVYPCNYGFIPGTKADDGDPLDILVYNNTPIARGTLVECHVIGCLDMIDSGKADYKILGVPKNHVRRYNNIGDIDPMFLRITKNFFKHYKDLENKTVEVGEWLDKKRAMEIIVNDCTHQCNTDGCC